MHLKTITFALSLALICGNVHAADITSNLYLHLKFAQNLNDSSPYTHSTQNYGATYTNDRFGQGSNALYFDGGDYLEALTTSGFTPTDVTVSAWVKYEIHSDGWILSKIPPYGGSGFGIQVDNATAYIKPYPGGTYVQPSLSEGSWAHVVMVYDSATDTLKTYIHGKLRATVTYTGGIVSNNALITVGRFGYAGGPRYWKGAIDEVRVYDRALDECDVQAIFVSEYTP